MEPAVKQMRKWKIFNITTSRDMDGVSLSKESCRFLEKERSLDFL
jgi:hypothetical protein